MASTMDQTPPFQTKEEYAYRVLREAILNGSFAPGDKLVMDHLSKEMHVSPIPIRGALQRLQTEGLVEITPHSGAVVSPISPDEIGEIFWLLEALEGLAFRAAAARLTAEELAELRGRLAEMDQTAAALLAAQQAPQASDFNERLEAWAASNDRFHRRVADFSGMKLLPELTGRVLDQWTRLRRSFRPTLAARVASAQAEHRQMIDLLAEGDAEALAALAVEHNRSARQAYLTQIHKTPTSEDASCD